MEVGRRRFMTGLMGLIVALSNLRSSLASATTGRLALRSVNAGDAQILVDMMNRCVQDDDGFHGKCGAWSIGWGQKFVTQCPDSPVITLDGVPVAFLEIPPIAPPLPALPATGSEEARQKRQLAEAARATFRVSAGGVDANLVGMTDAVRLFKAILYYATRKASLMGYQYLECFAPWDQHPRLPRKFSDYPGCELVMTSTDQVTGRQVYLLRWRLDDAISALSLEGAGSEALDAL